MRIYTYVLTDCHGNTDEDAVVDLASDIFLCGRNKNGEIQSFQSEPYHLQGWADEHGFTVKKHVIELDLNQQKIKNWDVISWQ